METVGKFGLATRSTFDRYFWRWVQKKSVENNKSDLANPDRRSLTSFYCQLYETDRCLFFSYRAQRKSKTAQA